MAMVTGSWTVQCKITRAATTWPRVIWFIKEVEVRFLERNFLKFFKNVKSYLINIKVVIFFLKKIVSD